MRSSSLIAALVACAGLSSQASAAPFLYTNGPLNGTVDGVNIYSPGDELSDSFVLSQAAVVTGVTFGVWVRPGNTVNTVDYGITTTPATYTDNGTVSVTSGSTTTNSFGLNVGTDLFSIPPTSLAAGTYYLVLQKATVNGTNPEVYWDQNSGPSSATHSIDGPIASESFSILGTYTVSSVPLPAALPLFATGLVGLGLLGCRRKRKAAA